MAKTSPKQPAKKKRNTRGMGSIRAKNGGYEGRITVKVNGKSKQISLFNKDKRILVQEMIKAKQESNDNEYIEKDKITLEQWLKKWIRIHKKPFVTARTLQGYIEKIKVNILPYLGNYPIQTLDRMILQEYFSDLATGNEKKSIKKYSPKTIREIKSILNMAFKDAEIDKIIKVNHIPTIKTPRVQKKKKKPTLTPAEQQEFIKIMLSENNGLCYIFILNTGLRPGESGGIKWKHYNYENSNIQVMDNYGKITYYDDDFNKLESTYEEKKLKTQSSYRTIPLQCWLNEIMHEYMLLVMKEKGYTKKEQLDNNYMFVNSLGNALSSDYLWDTLDKILKRHDFRHISVYQIRHLFATRCVDVNIPINQIKQYLGHALASTTMDFYVEYDEDTNKKEIEKLGDINNVNIIPKRLESINNNLSLIKNAV